MPWPIYRSIGEAALDLGVPREVLRWAKRNGCPAFAAKKVNGREFLRWWFQRYGSASPETEILDYQAERAARERAQRLLLEKKLELMNEDYVRWPEVERWVGVRVIQPLAQWMRSAPVAWSSMVCPHEPAKAKEQLEAMIASLRRLLDTMTASPGELQADDAADDEDDTETATETFDTAESPGDGMAG